MGQGSKGIERFHNLCGASGRLAGWVFLEEKPTWLLLLRLSVIVEPLSPENERMLLLLRPFLPNEFIVDQAVLVPLTRW